MDNLTSITLAKLLGAFFYYPPTSKQVTGLIDGLLQLDQLAKWPNQQLVTEQCQILSTQIQHAEIEYQFSLLFEGQGIMSAPPWGSVYLDQEKLLMGESQERYREFLQQQGLTLDTGMNEPEDQFGLMLMAYAILLEKQQFAAAQQLMTEYLLSWAPMYLDCLKQNQVSLFYQALAIIAEQYLQMI
ncbi:TorD/DmsD family molecular chaperone [Gilliamella apis]|uniref:TorD/DmsD family molecular chaperone n=1 Tax=Gilliamella apis TaxID=1970738 RepID=UPI001C2C4D97|nr:molecular chaperone [Gilliamella apis]